MSGAQRWNVEVRASNEAELTARMFEQDTIAARAGWRRVDAGQPRPDGATWVYPLVYELSAPAATYAPVVAPLTTSQPRSRILGALFGIFLGGLGIHKFYNGRTGQGIVYLLFCWTLIPVVVGFFEGVWYLTMSDRAYAARYP